MSGLGAAHDTLEHFPPGTPGIPDGFAGEMCAFGAMHWVRSMNHHDWWRSSIYEAQGSDMESFMPNLLYGQDLSPAPGWAIAKIEHYEGDYNFDTEEMRYHLRAALMMTLRNGADAKNGGYLLSSLVEERRRFPRDLLTDILGWMVVGYEKARERYHGVEPWRLGDLFQKIERDMDRHARSGNDGDYLIVRADTESMEVTIIHGNVWEEEEDAEFEEEEGEFA